jgi:hypothetical protein
MSKCPDLHALIITHTRTRFPNRTWIYNLAMTLKAADKEHVLHFTRRTKVSTCNAAKSLGASHSAAVGLSSWCHVPASLFAVVAVALWPSLRRERVCVLFAVLVLVRYGQMNVYIWILKTKTNLHFGYTHFVGHSEYSMFPLQTRVCGDVVLENWWCLLWDSHGKHKYRLWKYNADI